MDYKKRNYLILIIIFIGLAMLVYGFMFFGGVRTEDIYITIGAGRGEWFFASAMMPLSILVSGILSLYLGVPTFTKMLVKSLGKKEQVGIVSEEELGGKNHLLRLLGRSLVLGFFIANICYTLAANESVVLFMLTEVGETAMRLDNDGALLLPDPNTMIILVWMLAIPLTFIVVPIWVTMDEGLVATKKVRGEKFSSVNIATSRLYKIIKGYAGIGFIYNLTLLILDWGIFRKQGRPFSYGDFIVLIVPFVLISTVFPLTILMDYQKKNYKKKFEKIMVKLDMNKELKYTIELLDRR